MIFATIAAATASGAAVFAIIVSWFGAVRDMWWLFVLPVMCASGWLTMVVYERWSRFVPIYNRVRSDFLLVEKAIYFRAHENGHAATYRKKITLKALRHGLTCYHDKYHWTGDKGISVRSAVKEQELQRTIRRNVWQFYEVHFLKSLARGESVTTDIIWELEDARSAVPFISTVVEEPTEALRLEVMFDSSLGIKQVVCQVTPVLGSQRVVESKVAAIAESGDYVWEIKRPRLLHCYEIRWAY